MDVVELDKCAVNEEEKIPMPIRQYVDAIMAIQKLNDIKNIVNMDWNDDEECITMIMAIRAITG